MNEYLETFTFGFIIGFLIIYLYFFFIEWWRTKDE